MAMTEGKATFVAFSVFAAVMVFIAMGGIEGKQGDNGSGWRDGACSFDSVRSMGMCGGRRQTSLGIDSKNSTLKKNSTTTSVIDIVIEKNTTVDGTKNSNASSQNLSVIEQEMLTTGSSGGTSFFFSNSGLASETTVMLWVIAVVFWLITLQFLWIASSRRQKGRLVDISLLLTLMFLIPALGYLGMALGLGLLYEVVGVEVMDDITVTPGRVIMKPMHPPVFWIRHVSWALSTPLQLLLLMHIADEVSAKSTKVVKGREEKTAKRVPFSLKFYLIGLNCCIHACGVIGTLVPVVQVGKWTYWVFGMILYLMLLRQLYGADSVVVRIAVQNRTQTEYQLLVRFVVLSWTIFPLIWAISDGFRTVDANVREDLYAFLELFNKLGFILLFLDVMDLPHIPLWLRWASRVTGALTGNKRAEWQRERGDRRGAKPPRDGESDVSIGRSSRGGQRHGGAERAVAEV